MEKIEALLKLSYLSLILTHFMFPQAETRAEFAERSVAKLEKTIDDLEGMEPGEGLKLIERKTLPFDALPLNTKRIW